MGYVVQVLGINGDQWCTVPYLQDGEERTVYQVKHLAEEAMNAYDDLWGQVLRVVSVDSKHELRAGQLSRGRHYA